MEVGSQLECMSYQAKSRISDRKSVPSAVSLTETTILKFGNDENDSHHLSGVVSVDENSMLTETSKKLARFDSLHDVVIRSIQENGVQYTFQPGARLLTQGERPRGLIQIDSGIVEIVDASSGTLIDQDSAGAILGEMSLLTDHPCSASVIAKTKVIARVLDVKSYKHLCRTNPNFEIRLGDVVSSRLGHHQHDALCGKVLGGYIVQSCINRGGMGVVYRAKDGSGQTVALKMLMHKYMEDVQMHRQFDQEANLLSLLDHPNIVQLLDNFTAYRTRFLVLQFCDGSDLQEVLRAHGPFCESDARSILGQIALGVGEAHAHGIAHRDLKPANVLVDRRGRIAVTDFGLSRLREIDVADHRIVGTPAYMAPELFEGQNPGFSADWYAMGCIAFQLVTGKLLFRSADPQSLYQQKSELNPSKRFTTEFCTSANPYGSLSEDYMKLLRNAVLPSESERNIDFSSVGQWAAPVPHLVV